MRERRGLDRLRHLRHLRHLIVAVVALAAWAACAASAAWSMAPAARPLEMAETPPTATDDGQTRDFGYFSRFRPAGKAAVGKPATYRRKGPAMSDTGDIRATIGDSGGTVNEGAAASMSPRPPMPPLPDDAAIGVTLWRARPATSLDVAATRDIVQKSDGTKKEMVLTRFGGDAELAVGQEFRIGIETPRVGYLYVVDRALAADGSPGEPYLIFPTLGIRGGDNQVGAGQMVMLPTPPEEPFEIRDARGDLAAEDVIVLVTSKPLDVPTKEGRYQLSRELVETWVHQWSAPSESYEMEGGENAGYTVAERAAATSSKRLLTAADPTPQMVVRIAAAPGEPLLARVTIRVRRAGAGE